MAAGEVGKTRAQKNRDVRREALRDQLRQQGHVQYLVENIVKIENLSDINKLDDETEEKYKARIAAARHQIDGLNIANNHRHRLINKYVPDLKAVTEPIEFDFDPSNPAAQALSVMKAASQGLMSPDTVKTFADAIKSIVDIQVTTEMQERIKALESALERSSEEKA